MEGGHRQDLGLTVTDTVSKRSEPRSDLFPFSNQASLFHPARADITT